MEQCLNCGNTLKGPYCELCGQKGSTHRLSLYHFVQHELVHGIWHVDKGFFATLWKLLTRPGRFLQDYLSGKRVGAFNLVTMLVIGTGLVLFISDFNAQMSANEGKIMAADVPKGLRQLYYYIEHYAKWLLLSLVPLFTILSAFIFRRKKLYFTEHLAVNGYIFAAFLFLILFLGLVFKLPFLHQADEHGVDLMLGFFYLPFAYWQFWKESYRLPGFTWRFVSLLLLYGILTLVLFLGSITTALKISGQ